MGQSCATIQNQFVAASLVRCCNSSWSRWVLLYHLLVTRFACDLLITRMIVIISLAVTCYELAMDSHIRAMRYLCMADTIACVVQSGERGFIVLYGSLCSVSLLFMDCSRRECRCRGFLKKKEAVAKWFVSFFGFYIAQLFGQNVARSVYGKKNDFWNAWPFAFFPRCWC